MTPWGAGVDAPLPTADDKGVAMQRSMCRGFLLVVSLIGGLVWPVGLTAQEPRRFLQPVEVHSPGGLTVGVDTPLILLDASGNDTQLRYARVSLTNAQVLQLHLTPVTIVAAPGAGKYIDVIGGQVIFDRTAAYTAGASDDLRLYYTSRATGPAASGVIETTTPDLLDATADVIVNFAGAVVDTNPPTTDAAVVLQNTSGVAFGSGNASNALIVVVLYRIQETGL